MNEELPPRKPVHPPNAESLALADALFALIEAKATLDSWPYRSREAYEDAAHVYGAAVHRLVKAVDDYHDYGPL